MRWFNRRRRERELDDELAFHVEAHTRDLIAEDVAPDEARRRALAAFGTAAPIRELARDARGGRWLHDLAADVRYAFRTLRHEPGFAAVAILTLTLGIGANAAIFSMVNALLLRPLPVREPSRLVLFSDDASEGTISTTVPPGGRWDEFSSEAFNSLRAQRLPFESIGAFAAGEQTVALDIPGRSNGSQMRAAAHLVSGNYFDVIGAVPALGRALADTDDTRDAAPVAVVSDGFWRERLGGDAQAIGRSLTLNGTRFSVVGVMRREFFGERVRRSPDIWVPLVHQPTIQRRESAADRPNLYWLSLFGRLSRGQTILAAQNATTTALRQFLTGAAGAHLNEADRQRIGTVRLDMVSGARGISVARDQNRNLLALLLAAVAVILLIACSNVGTLFLARAGARQREVAVRRALGAGRGRLVRQWLTESTLLAGMGAIGGVTVAWVAAPPLFATFVSVTNPAKATIDGVVLAFTTGAALLASVIFGLAPALRASRVDPLSTLRAASPVARTRRFAGVLDPFVVAQIAMSMTLVVAAAVLVRTVINLERAPLGFDRNHMLLAGLGVRATDGMNPNPHATDGRPEMPELWGRVYARLRDLPGVESVTLAGYSPFSNSRSTSSVEIDGYVPAHAESPSAETVRVGPNYPQTMGIPLLAGRAISDRDTIWTEPVAMISASFARKYFAGRNPLGRRLEIGGTGYEVIGVMEDVRFRSVREASSPIVYLPVLQATYLSASCEVQLRTTADADQLTQVVRAAVASVDPRIEVGRVRSLRAQVLAQFTQERTAAAFLVGFATLALIVAAVGLYGTVAYGLQRRTSEIGLRIALGAAGTDVVRLIARETAMRLGIGLLIGCAMTFWAGRFLTAQLFGVTPADPLSILAAAAVLSSVVGLTTVRPLRRAMRIDPVIALRTE